MTTELSDIPAKLQAGDTWTWTKSVSDYLATDGWALSYLLVKADSRIEVTSAADGDDHAVTVTAANTADYAPGEYKYQAYVTKAAERYTVETGTVKVKANYANAAASLDDREHAEIMLAAIQATLQGKATKDQQSYSISTGGISRSISRMSFGELIEAEKHYEAKIAELRKAERIEKGLKSGRQVLVRMPV